MTAFGESVHVAVIIVNYRGWRDTLECLESVFRSNHRRFTAIVIDNASPDESWDRLVGWAFEERPIEIIPPPHLAAIFARASVRPAQTTLFEWDGETLNAGRTKGVPEALPRLALIKSPNNGGFASANNLGLKLACSDASVESVWFLNNDTVVEPTALSVLTQQTASRAIWGTRIMSYGDSGKVQTLGGGTLNRFTGFNRNLNHAVPRLDYITGASLYLQRAALDEIGDWDESYFLTWEDIDYSLRARRKGYLLRIANDAVIHHKETVSIGKRSFLDVFLRTRNGLRFTARHHPWCLPTVFVAYLLKFPRGLWLRDPVYLKATTRAFFDFLTGR